MDREDAAFAVDVLERRISEDRGELDAAAASSLMRLTTIAVHIKHMAGGWPPALVAASELMAVARLGAAVLEHPIAGDVQPFIDSMRTLIEQAPPRLNREQRRARIRVPHRQLLVPPKARLV